jgi:hypothetical protein
MAADLGAWNTPMLSVVVANDDAHGLFLERNKMQVGGDRRYRIGNGRPEGSIILD